jgi:hypothetical protein
MVGLNQKVHVSVIEYWDLEFICNLVLAIWCFKIATIEDAK